jgi:hypothetical protein
MKRKLCHLFFRGGLTVTREGRYLMIYPSEGASGENLVYYADLQEPLRSGFNSNLTIIPVVSKFEAAYTVSDTHEK